MKANVVDFFVWLDSSPPFGLPILDWRCSSLKKRSNWYIKAYLHAYYR